MTMGEKADATSADRDELKIVTSVDDLSVETTPDSPEDVVARDDPASVYPAEAQLDDGGDVASRNPDAIAREIEQTRAELADTIDAIADRISPKRAASRGAQALKAQVSSARDRVSGDGPALAAQDSTPDSGALSQPAPSSPPIAQIAALAGIVLVIAMLLRRRRSR
jgi:MYXO-CTERM domain-containing protein